MPLSLELAAQSHGSLCALGPVRPYSSRYTGHNPITDKLKIRFLGDSTAWGMDKGEATNGLQETTKPHGAMILLCDSRRDMASYFMLLLGLKILLLPCRSLSPWPFIYTHNGCDGTSSPSLLMSLL